MKRELVSYPKSGRTWLRYMLAQLDNTASVRFHHDGFEFNDGGKPPLSFDVRHRLNRYSEADRVIYLERDPRDVMVSLFHQVTGRFRDFFDYRGSLSDFIRDPYFGAHNLRQFREMWSEIAATKGFLKVTYEECHQDRSAVLGKMLDYWKIPVTEDAKRRAVEAGAFENMKATEEAGAFRQPWLRKRMGAGKIRRGLVGGFRSELSAEDVEYLNRTFGISAPGPNHPSLA
jgi:hypothetical protein